MNIKEYAIKLCEKCEQVQLKLYEQIDKLEYCTNLVKMSKPKGAEILKLKSFKNNKTTILNQIDDYKRELQACALFADVKLYIIRKKLYNKTATKESLDEIASSLYGNRKMVQIPKKLNEKLEKYNIKFTEKDIVNLDTTIAEANDELTM